MRSEDRLDFIGVSALNLDHIYEIENPYGIEDLGLEEGGEFVFSEKEEKLLKGRLALFATLKKVCAGGSGANTIHMLSLLGFKTALFGVLGKDREAEIYLSFLGMEERKKIVRRGKTSVTHILNIKDRERLIVLIPKGAGIRIDDVDLSYLSQTNWIHMSSFADDLSMEAQRFIKNNLLGKVKFSIDPGHIYAAKKGQTLDLISGMDVLFITEKELDILFGKNGDPIKKALNLVKMVVVKRGKEGSSLYTPDLAFHFQAEAVKKIDDTGAGDVLAGIFLGFIMKGLEPSFALALAVKGASLSIRDYGRDGYPTKEELEHLYEDLLVHNRQR